MTSQVMQGNLRMAFEEQFTERSARVGKELIAFYKEKEWELMLP